MTGSADRDELPTARLSPRPRRTMLVPIVGFLIIAVVVVAVLATRSGSPAASAPASRPAAPITTPAQAPESEQAEVTIGAHESVTAIPHSFLGFSTEYWTLPVDEHHISLYKRILSMIHVQGDGRFVLRIGGDSSDHAVWDPAARRLPPWAYAVTPALVRRTARIVRQLGLRVIIDLNTFTSAPRLGAQWARAAEAGFPKGSIIGFEIGNEPDLYSHAQWVSELKGSGFDLAKLPLTITPASYVRDYRAFARALISVVPRVPLLAPALANPVRDLNWIVTLLRSPHPGLRVVSVHRYPYSACSSPGKPNSVTCGGVRGVSNSFATALWAPDALFELVRSGVIGADLHVRVYSVNAPFYYDHARYPASAVALWPGPVQADARARLAAGAGALAHSALAAPQGLGGPRGHRRAQRARDQQGSQIDDRPPAPAGRRPGLGPASAGAFGVLQIRRHARRPEPQ